MYSAEEAFPVDCRSLQHLSLWLGPPDGSAKDPVEGGCWGALPTVLQESIHIAADFAKDNPSAIPGEELRS